MWRGGEVVGIVSNWVEAAREEEKGRGKKQQGENLIYTRNKKVIWD
jgi:hypothetical protein